MQGFMQGIATTPAPPLTSTLQGMQGLQGFNASPHTHMHARTRPHYA